MSSNRACRKKQTIASVGMCPGRQESEVVKKDFINLTFLWKPQIVFGVSIRFLSLFTWDFFLDLSVRTCSPVGVVLYRKCASKESGMRGNDLPRCPPNDAQAP